MHTNKDMKILSSKNGFTLIELLVVVAIIGVLSALLMANFVGIRQRARDGQRKSDLRQIQSALELFRADMGYYPTSSSNPTLVSNGYIICKQTISQGGTTYMKSVPCDPLGSDVSYRYSSTTGTYCLRACLENTNDPDTGLGQACDISDSLCTDIGFKSYTVENP